MRKLFYLYTVLFFICFACSTQKEVTYEFPAGMMEHVKVAYKEQCDKGRVLYEINCARCHTRKEKRKTIIPDFKQEQLAGYALRISNAKHERNLQDSLITTEEIGLIMTFLTYKKRNEVSK